MSVGHVARVFEQAGIPTVVIGIRAFRMRLAAMRLPRLLLTPHLLGHTLGAPYDAAGQRAALMAALDLLQSATAGNTMVEWTGTRVT